WATEGTAAVPRRPATRRGRSIGVTRGPVYCAHEHPPDLDRGAHHRLAHREADHDARPVPVVAQRAGERLQPEEQPRSDDAARRTDGEGGGRRAVATAPGAGEVRIRQPRAEVSPGV